MVLKTTTTTNFPKLTILVASVGLICYTLSMACRMDYVLLLFVIIDDRLLEKKGQEKKHEKKKIQKQLSIYTCTIQCMYILWLKNREKLLCKWADVYQILMERFHMKSLTSTVLAYQNSKTARHVGETSQFSRLSRS